MNQVAIEGNIRITDLDGEVLCRIDGLACRAVTPASGDTLS